MCGLAGVAAKYIQERHRKVFTELLVGASFRGHHATGVAAVYKAYSEKEPNYIFDKCVGEPYELFARKAYDTVLNKTNSRALIGHCRHGTIGGLTRQNAHPFRTDSSMVIGCHNGTIRGTQENQQYFGTDSECLLNNIDEKGIEEVLPTISGAWALTYFDCKDNTLNIIRNSERTLYLAGSPKDNEFYWASEEGLLRWVLDRNSVKYEDVILLRENTLFSIKLFDDNPLAKESVKYTTITGKEESRADPSASHFPGYVWKNGQWSHTTTHSKAEEGGETQGAQTLISPTTPKTGLPQPTETGPKTTKSSVDGSLTTTPTTSHLVHTTYGDKKVSKGRFRELLSMGCVNCERISPHDTDDNDVHFYADQVFLCDECNDDDDVRELIITRIGEHLEGEYEALSQMCN